MTISATASKVIDDNKALMASAAVFEAGRIANNKLAALIGAQLPAPMNFFADTPIGHLVLANLLKAAGEQFRPGNQVLQRVANGMVVAAYTEVIQSFDLEGILNQLLDDRSLAVFAKEQGGE